MQVSLTKQINCWHNFVKNEEQLRTKLIKDVKLCRVILSNKKVFSEFHYFSGTTYPKFTAKVSNETVDTSYPSHFEYFNATHCYGGNEPGYFAYEVKRMTHLSQFLMTYAAWLAKNK